MTTIESREGVVLPIGQVHAHEVLRELPADAPPKIACVTLDLERDYGSRTGLFTLGQRAPDLAALRAFFERERVPLSVFVVTDLLDGAPGALQLALRLGDDWHAHSHTHRVDGRESAAEIATSAATFARHFGHAPAGYRAPMGLLSPEDVPRLAAAGFSFSASIFPTWRPGRYDHRRAPVVPLRYTNGLLELPFGVILGLRFPVAVSYFKLLGATLGRGLLSAAPLPPVLVVNLHLHDVLPAAESFDVLPPRLRLVYGVNRDRGLSVLRMLVSTLQGSGYSFLTMSDLARLCARATFESGAPA